MMRHIPTNRPILVRLWRCVEAWHLRIQLAGAESDLDHHTDMLAVLPMQIDMTRKHIGELRVQLIQREGGE
jgi:hypothetical protein